MIKEGTIVWLKSGGPAMTVKYKTISHEWLCSWFVKNELKEAAFAEEQLTLEEPDGFDD